MSVVAPGGDTAAASKPQSASNFSFKTPALPTTPSSLKHRRVSLALPQSPRVVEGWSFRDDTGLDSHVAESSTSALAQEKKTKIRKVDSETDKDKIGSSSMQADPTKSDKKPRKKWTPEETQMLVTGCNKHGVGNWKTILRDPILQFDNRSPVDLKDRFRTYFPDAYKQHYPNAKTHLSSKVRSTLPDGSSIFEKTRSKRRRPFTEEEDRALKEGYEKYGTVWATIVKDYPIFQEQNRRSTDLRDRFRNAFPELYQLAGYKPRNAKKKQVETKRTAMDDQLATMSTGGPVRSRRRAHTHQGLLRGGIKSVPQSTACSEDEDSSGGEDESESSPAFRRPATPIFADASPSPTKKTNTQASYTLNTDTSIAVEDEEMDMITLDPLAEALSLPDIISNHSRPDMEAQSHEWSSGVNTPTHSNHWSTAAGSPTSSHLSSDFLMNGNNSSPFLQRRSDVMNPNNNMGMIGKSAWGTDWFSPNPRLDPSSNGANSSSYLDHPSPASPFSFHHLNHGVLDRYDLFPASMPADFSSEVGVGDTHSTFSDELFQPSGFRGFTHHSNYAGDLIFGARTHQPQQGFYPNNVGGGGGYNFGLGLSGMSLPQNTGIHPMQLHTPSMLSGIDETGLGEMTLDDQVSSSNAADPLGIPLPPDAMDEDLREDVPVIEPPRVQQSQQPSRQQSSEQERTHQHSGQVDMKNDPQKAPGVSDPFSLDDLVDLSNELHATPPATPLTHPRPIRRSSGSVLNQYPATGGLHMRSISVPPSEFRNNTINGVNNSALVDFDDAQLQAMQQRMLATAGSQTDISGLGLRHLNLFQPAMNQQASSSEQGQLQAMGQGRTTQEPIGDGDSDSDADEAQEGSDPRPQTPTLASRHLLSVPTTANHSLSSSSSSSQSSTDDCWRPSSSGNAGTDIYHVPFLDLHYYGHGAMGGLGGAHGLLHPGIMSSAGGGDDGLMGTAGQMHAQALDLAGSTTSSSGGRLTRSGETSLPFGSMKPHHQPSHRQTVTSASLIQAFGHGQQPVVNTNTHDHPPVNSIFKQGSGLGRSQSHHRGQSAVNPQDLMLRGDNKRKRASWDGRNVGI